jgi:transposase
MAQEAHLELFKLALGLADPWQVTRTDFDPDSSRLDLYLDFARGSRFACPECKEADCQVHDTEDKTWRHLDFFQHQAYLHARVPRVRCSAHGVRLVDVPWARQGSGFTLLFEALLLQFSIVMPVAAVEKMTRENDTRIWRVLEHYVTLTRENEDFSDVRRVGMDETSAAKGHDYITLFMDLDDPRVLFATEGKDAGTVETFATDLENHCGDPRAITEATMDMSRAFINGTEDHLPGAEITFDRFHVMKGFSEMIDEVRRGEVKDNPALRKTRYLWLKNETKLMPKQQQELAWLSRPSMRLATARAHRWREDFAGFYDQPDAQAGEAYLERWCYGAKRSRLQPLKDVVKMIESHKDGILAWHVNRATNGLLEGTNSLIQAAKARARGYRNKRYMITVVYLIAGKLPLPTLSRPLSVAHTM